MQNLLIDKNDNPVKDSKAYFPYFVEIEKPGKRKIKIPCVNEKIAKKILTAYSNHNSYSEVPLVRD